QPPAAGEGGTAVEDADVVQAEEAAFERVAARGGFAIHPPGEVQQQPREALLQKGQVDLAEPQLQILQEQGGEGSPGTASGRSGFSRSLGRPWPAECNGRPGPRRRTRGTPTCRASTRRHG